MKGPGMLAFVLLYVFQAFFLNIDYLEFQKIQKYSCEERTLERT